MLARVPRCCNDLNKINGIVSCSVRTLCSILEHSLDRSKS